MYYVRLKDNNVYLSQSLHDGTLSIYLGDFDHAVKFDSIEHAKIGMDSYQKFMGISHDYVVVKVFVEIC